MKAILINGYGGPAVLKATDLAKIPEGADLVDMAALPTVTTTGAQLASLALGGRLGATVLVTGAVGNVGRSAVYTAKSRGARVIAGVLKRHVAKAEAAGVDGVVALDDAEAAKALEPVDAVADTVGGQTADEVTKKIKPGGIFASWKIHSALLPASAPVVFGGSKAIRKAEKLKCEQKLTITTKQQKINNNEPRYP